MELRFQSSGLQELEGAFVRLEDLKFCSCWDGDGPDEVAVVIVEEEDVVHAACGCDEDFSRLIGVDLA